MYNAGLCCCCCCCGFCEIACLVSRRGRKSFVRVLRGNKQIDDVVQKGIPVTDLLSSLPGLLQINHGRQQPFKALSCGYLVSHEAMNVPNVVQNHHGLGNEHPLFAHQYAIGNLVVRQRLAQQYCIDRCIAISVAGGGVLSTIVGGCVGNGCWNTHFSCATRFSLAGVRMSFLFLFGTIVFVVGTIQYTSLSQATGCIRVCFFRWSTLVC